MVSMWEKLSLAPYDQTKDVLYLAVVPDCAVVVEKCRIFMEELSRYVYNRGYIKFVPLFERLFLEITESIWMKFCFEDQGVRSKNGLRFLKLVVYNTNKQNFIQIGFVVSEI